MDNKRIIKQDEPKTRLEEWQEVFKLIEDLNKLISPLRGILHDLGNQASYLQMSDKTKNKKSK